MRSARHALALCLALLAASAPSAAVTEGQPAPELAGITRWIGSPPLSLAQLRGKVVLVHFWTFGCINCKNTLPSVVRWAETYRERGLVVIGVHTPEFAWERPESAVESAVARWKIGYPVAIDDDSRTWQAFGNRYWPAFYFVDKRGVVRHVRFGEGGYDDSEHWIERLLAEAPAAG